MLTHIKRLSEIRKASGLTQLQLAHYLGVSQPNIARLEKAPETASLQQLEEWLKVTSLLMLPRGDIELTIKDAHYSAETWFALGLEEVLRDFGIDVEIYRKPLVAICADGASGWAISTTLIRSLLSSGDRYFAGFYLPSRDCTVLWRHVSTRPRRLDATVVVLDGELQPWMRSAPTYYLQLAPENSGSFIVAEGAITGQTVVVYSDHPLLLHCDVLQAPPLGMNDHSYCNLAMIANAEIRVLCTSQGMRVSATSLLMSIASGRAFDFVALEEGQADARVRETFHSIFGGRPIRILEVALG